MAAGHRIDVGRNGRARPLNLARQKIEQLAKRPRPPELMTQPVPPALRHFNRLKQGAEQAQIADVDAIILQSRRIEGFDGESQNLGLGGHGIGGREPFDSGLIKLGWMEFAAITGLETEGGARIAIARLVGCILRMGEMIAAGGNSEVRSQTELAAVGIGEDVGARADVLAGRIEKHVSGLDNVRGDEIEAGASEHRHDAPVLRIERLAFGGGFPGHGVRSGGCQTSREWFRQAWSGARISGRAFARARHRGFRLFQRRARPPPSP